MEARRARTARARPIIMPSCEPAQLCQLKRSSAAMVSRSPEAEDSVWKTRPTTLSTGMAMKAGV